MTEAVANPPVLFEPAARPATEIGWSRSGVSDRGLAEQGDAINAMLGGHFGMLIHDTMDPLDLALTPSDPCVAAGVHRRWMVKTPSYLEITGAASTQCTLQVRVAKGAGAGLEYDIYVGGVLQTTYTFGAGGLAEQWVTLDAALELDDTLDYQEIRIEQVGWHGGSASTDYVRAVRLYPNVWASIEDQADGWRFLQVPVPVSVFGINDSAASWMLQSMQRNLRYLYERRVPTLYASSGAVVENASVLTPWSRVRLDTPHGAAQVRFWFYCYRQSGTTAIGVEGYTTSTSGVTAEPPVSAGWVSVLADVSPRGAPAFRLVSRRMVCFSVCAYCEDAVYGG